MSCSSGFAGHLSFASANLYCKNFLKFASAAFSIVLTILLAFLFHYALQIPTDLHSVTKKSSLETVLTVCIRMIEF